MVNRCALLLLLAGVVPLLTGCRSSAPVETTPTRAKVSAVRAQTPVKVDGKLDDEVWQRATVYKLTDSLKSISAGRTHVETGECMAAWDDTHFYLAVRLHDSDIVAEDERQQWHHYRTGDCLELFLKPMNSRWYWELYVTPHNRLTTFWFPSRGRNRLPSCFTYKCELKGAARLDGTLNNWRDMDRMWTAEMAVPVSVLTSEGDSFGPGSRWTILVGRYNYSAHLDQYETTQFPQQSLPGHHYIEEYGVIVFEE